MYKNDVIANYKGKKVQPTGLKATLYMYKGHLRWQAMGHALLAYDT